MRQNHDYVSMDDYQADMKETADHAAALLDAQKRDIRDRERYFAAAIIAAGGRLEVSDSAMVKAFGVTLRRWRNEANGSTVFEIES